MAPVGPRKPDDGSLTAATCFCRRINRRSSRASIRSLSEPSRRHRFEPDGERGGGGEADRHPLPAGGQTQAEGDVGLAGSTGPEGVMSQTCLRHDDVLARRDPPAAGRFRHLHLVELGDRHEVDAVGLLVAGNFAALMRHSTVRRSRSSANARKGPLAAIGRRAVPARPVGTGTGHGPAPRRRIGARACHIPVRQGR